VGRAFSAARAVARGTMSGDYATRFGLTIVGIARSTQGGD